MRVVAAAGAALMVIGMPSWCLAQAKLCDRPRQMEGFKTCANVEKAEAEGAFTLYSTDPEQGQVKLGKAKKSSRHDAGFRRLAARGMSRSCRPLAVSG